MTKYEGARKKIDTSLAFWETDLDRGPRLAITTGLVVLSVAARALVDIAESLNGLLEAGGQLSQSPTDHVPPESSP